VSLAVDIADVSAVLLTDGSWWRVTDFDTDAYEFLDDGQLIYNGERQGCSTGFRFVNEHGNLVVGPMTSIVAVRIDSKEAL
jgi:hypothetical protein